MNINKTIKTVVIPIAGYGSRMFPETLLINKALLPIGNKPSIIHIIEEVVNANIFDIIFIISPSQKDLINLLKPTNDDLLHHFPNNPHLLKFNDLLQKVTINYIIQEQANGLGDAIYHAKSFIKKNSAFGVILGDNVILSNHKDYGIKALIDQYQLQPANYIGVIKVPIEETKLYGIINGKEVNNPHNIKVKLDTIIEKPVSNPPSHFACLGRYVFEDSIFAYLDQVRDPQKELILPDAIELAIKNDLVYGIKLDGKWLDVGNKLGFIKANIDYGLFDSDTSESLIEYLKQILC